MNSLKKKEKVPITTMPSVDEKCCYNNPLGCFFCIMKEPNSSIRSNRIKNYFKKMSLIDEDQELVLVLSGLWTMAMSQPNDKELPSLGIFECMTSLINKGINHKSWLHKNQNIYIPYYAAHIIGSYTMNNVDFAIKALDCGVLVPLLDLSRGNMTWVEQRVAIRAIGHLASYDKTFKDVAIYEGEIVKLAMKLASTCLEDVYKEFVGLKDLNMRLKYHCDLLTRGVGGLEMENRKAEEWASQLQCWSLHLLNCFAIKERCLNLICDQNFLKDLSEMWGGLANDTSPGGVGLVRVLCYNKDGRRCIAESKDVIKNLCTRYKVLEVVSMCLVDLVELRTLGGKSNVGNTITRTLLDDFKQRKVKIKNNGVQQVLEEMWGLKVDRKKREKNMSDEILEEKRVMVSLMKQQGNNSFWLGKIEEAMMKYSEALDLCPLRFRKERIVLYSNRAQCKLLLGEANDAISDTTKALSLSSPTNSHAKSLWRRSQAYDMKGLAKESLMDCIMFVNCCFKMDSSMKKNMRIPYYAVRMINKQMESTWLFKNAQLKTFADLSEKPNHQPHDELQISHKEHINVRGTRILLQKKGFMEGLSSISEEHQLIEKGDIISRRNKKAVFTQSM
ncbi:hypothetical protein RND71_027684 [Anisodus tanguticus]|uniref:ARM repeat N-terminal plant domain-containing protein n=1 Tax=Anisodus tanguticus TaxID=243964 RepID=A0AAE1V6E6_9SOLA|nr:hypothetical protein RND71_027684 [Anisodus tanguticus]